MAEKIYKIQRELEEKRLKRLQEQSFKSTSNKDIWQQSTVVSAGIDNSPLRFSYVQNRFEQPSKKYHFYSMLFSHDSRMYHAICSGPVLVSHRLVLYQNILKD